MTTEYGTRYGRKLWDEIATAAYFKLANERKARMLRGIRHSPIHWEHEVEETINTICEQSVKPETESPKPDTPPAKPARSSNESPNSKSSSRHTCCGCPCKVVSICAFRCCTDKCNSPKSKLKRTASSTGKASRSTSRCPSSNESESPIEDNRPASRQGSAVSGSTTRARLQKRLPQSVPAKNGSKTPCFRPESLSNHSKPACKSPNSKKQPPFAMFGANKAGEGTRPTHNVKSESNEIYSSALRAKSDRERLQVYKSKIKRKKERKEKSMNLGTIVDAICAERPSGVWTTEYKRNYKPYVF